MIKVIVIICIIIFIFVIDLGIEGFTSNKEVYRLGDIVKSEFYKRNCHQYILKNIQKLLQVSILKNQKK